MFAQLGYIRFERTTYFQGHETTWGFGFAEHGRVQGKPKLQDVGDELTTKVLDMGFHRDWCDPNATMAKLVEVAARKQAMALSFGDGTYHGKFVVTQIVETWENNAPDGSIISAVMRVQLKEWVDDEPLVTAKRKKQAEAPAVKKPSGKPPASAKKGTPAFTVQTTTNKDGFSVDKIVRKK